MKKAQKLSHRLLLIPSLVILSCLGIIFLIFNLTVQNYIASSTTDKMEEELLFHSHYKTNEKTGKTPARQSRSSIVNVGHIVLDSENSLVYPERQKKPEKRI